MTSHSDSYHNCDDQKIENWFSNRNRFLQEKNEATIQEVVAGR